MYSSKYEKENIYEVLLTYEESASLKSDGEIG